MATIYNLKPGELFEVPKDDEKTECKLCFEPAKPKDGIDLGPLYQYGNPITLEDGEVDIEVYSAHYFCLIFAPALEQNGEEEEGIKGFMPKDILKVPTLPFLYDYYCVLFYIRSTSTLLQYIREGGT